MAERSTYSVVSEVVSLCQLLEQRVDLEVVEDVDALHVAEAVVQDSRQLRGRQKNLNVFQKVFFLPPGTKSPSIQSCIFTVTLRVHAASEPQTEHRQCWLKTLKLKHPPGQRG